MRVAVIMADSLLADTHASASPETRTPQPQNEIRAEASEKGTGSVDRCVGSARPHCSRPTRAADACLSENNGPHHDVPRLLLSGGSTREVMCRIPLLIVEGVSTHSS